MAALCLFYFIAVGTCVALAALFLESAMPAGAQRRWIWCGSIVLSLFLPPILSTKHSASIINVFGYNVVEMPTSHQAAATPYEIGRNLLECGAPLGMVFVKIWLAVSICLILWGITNAARIWYLSRRSRAEALSIDGENVTVTESVGPATVGLFRTRVVIPKWVLALPSSQRSYVITHEAEHRRVQDSRVLAAASILVCLWPWNVALWWQLHRLHMAIEMDCDRRVVRSLGNASAYGELLLRVAEVASRVPGLQPAFAGRAGMLEQRLMALVAPRTRHLALRALAPIFALGLMYMVFSVPHPQLRSHQAEYHAATSHDH
ncbi:MAG TPA: M56 family metallopeptidase [Gemmatimonadaceae bacterium]